MSKLIFAAFFLFSTLVFASNPVPADNAVKQATDKAIDMMGDKADADKKDEKKADKKAAKKAVKKEDKEHDHAKEVATSPEHKHADK